MSIERQTQPSLSLPLLETKVRQFAHVNEMLAACAHDFKLNRGMKAKTYTNETEESFVVTSRHGLAGLWSVRTALYEEIEANGFGAQLRMMEQEAAIRYGITND